MNAKIWWYFQFLEIFFRIHMSLNHFSKTRVFHQSFHVWNFVWSFFQISFCLSYSDFFSLFFVFHFVFNRYHNFFFQIRFWIRHCFADLTFLCFHFVIWFRYFRNRFSSMCLTEHLGLHFFVFFYCLKSVIIWRTKKVWKTNENCETNDENNLSSKCCKKKIEKIIKIVFFITNSLFFWIIDDFFVRVCVRIRRFWFNIVNMKKRQ